MWKPDSDGRVPESWKIRWEIVEYTRGRGLDVGCGPYKPYGHFIGVDNNQDEKLFGQRADAADVIVPDATKLDLFATHSVDFVFSSHTLEHIHDYKTALREWWRVIKPGGYLVLYLPHKDHYPNIGTPLANPDHKHDFVPDDITAVMHDIKLEKAACVREEIRAGEQDDEYSFLQVWRKAGGDRLKDVKPEPAQKRVAIMRYGTYGDCIQMTSVLPWLKEQGYHVTWYCVPRGYEVIKEHPLIDKIVLQDENQIPQHRLGEWFDFVKTKYDVVVQGNSIVEGFLLPSHDSPHFGWSKEMRHAALNFNYVETLHRANGIPYRGLESKFHMSASERAWVKEKRKFIDGPVVVWSLSGSSVHKIWPYVDNLAARILIEFSDAHIFFVGGPEEQALTREWENEKRIHTMCGRWDIRQSISMAMHADLVIGPETGVLNAVAAEDDVAKVIFLSHSSHENLTRDWRNTAAFASEATPCYPCHQLHLGGFDTCTRAPEGGAACQNPLTPDVMWPAVDAALRSRSRRRIA